MTTKTPAQTPTAREVDIYVFNKKTKNWQIRTTVIVDTTGDDTKDANKALRSYGIAGTRPRLGEAESKSGRRFKAVPTV
jgi:hypothetical protein